MSDNQDESLKNGVTNGDGGTDDAIDGNAPAASATKKGKKNKGKKGAGSDSGAGAAPMSVEQQEKLKKAMEILNLQAAGPAKNEEEAAKKSYQFWSTQPVPSIDEVVTSNECITPDLPITEVRQDGFTLPQGFQWDTLQLDDPLVLKELYVLLNENYVEDDDNMFRWMFSKTSDKK